MATPQLFVETYTVYYGTGPGDAGKKVWVDDCMDRAVADSLVSQFNDLNARKLIAQPTYGGKVAWWEVSSRTLVDFPQSTTPSVAEIRAFLQGQGASVQTFVRIKNDAGTNVYVQLGVAQSSQLDALVT